MPKYRSELTERQWRKIKPFLPREQKPTRRGGRKSIANRGCLEGILWVAKSGARWEDLPPHFPSPSTCWRRLKEWEEKGVWLKIWRAFLGMLDDRGKLRWAETFMDGSFASAKKGAHSSEKPNAERVRSGWCWQMAKVLLWQSTWTRQLLRKLP